MALLCVLTQRPLELFPELSRSWTRVGVALVDCGLDFADCARPCINEGRVLGVPLCGLPAEGGSALAALSAKLADATPPDCVPLTFQVLASAPYPWPASNFCCMLCYCSPNIGEEFSSSGLGFLL